MMPLRLVLVGLVFVLPAVSLGKNVSMKIVSEPSTYGFLNNIPAMEREEHRLLPRAVPSNFSGPPQFRTLLDKCFNFTSAQYRYNFCPFYNLTQYELSFRWNAYQGILGIYQEWKVENYSFVAMRMTKGDECGALERTAEVRFQCGPRNKLLNVTEPKRCFYVATFVTPLVCHRDAMLVYPRLPPHLQNQWDILETELHNEEITEKGYSIRLRKILEQAGFQTSQVTLLNSDTTKKSDVKEEDGTEFKTLAECNAEYDKLKEEVEEMKKEIEGMKILLDLRHVKPNN